MIRKFFLSLFFLLMLYSTTSAQFKDCPDEIAKALDTASSLCSSIKRNEVCYGNSQVVAKPRPDVKNFLFEKPGQIEKFSRIKSLEFSGLDIKTGVWGIAMMALQANLPNTLPGQNVMFLIFGDVQIQGDAQATKSVRSFYFQSTVSTLSCHDAPPNGLLVQTPEGARKVTFSVNDINVELGSTVFMQAQPATATTAGQYTIFVLEGHALLQVAGQTLYVPAGAGGTVPLDTQGKANGVPVLTFFHDSDVAYLPISKLPKSIQLTPSVLDSVGAGKDVAANNIPASSIWTYGYKLVSGCADWNLSPDLAGPVRIKFNADRSTFTLNADTYQQASVGVYVRSVPYMDVVWVYTIRFTSATTFDGNITAWWAQSKCKPFYSVTGSL